MLLKIENLTKEFIRNKKTIKAVDGVSFEIEKGCFAVLIGHSGSGKSTLMNMVTGMLRPTSGSIAISGENICKKSKDELSFMRNRDLGYIMQGQSLLPNFTLLENICLPSFLGQKETKEKALEIIHELGLSGLENAYPKSLSGGELRRGSIGRSMINSPSLIIADEPTVNLDPENTAMIIKYFQKINRSGTAILTGTHNMDFLSCAEKVFSMEKGILKEIPPEPAKNIS